MEPNVSAVPLHLTIFCLDHGSPFPSSRHLASTCSQLPRQSLTPADHPSGSSSKETLDTSFSQVPVPYSSTKQTAPGGWGLVSICGCGVSSTGLAGSYVYFRSAQEEGTGNSVGEGLAFRDRKCFLLGTPPRAGHRPRPLLFVWALLFCFGGHLPLLFGRSGGCHLEAPSELGSHCTPHILCGWGGGLLQKLGVLSQGPS